MKTLKADKPIRMYKVMFKGENHGQTFAARSPSAARYQYWRYLDFLGPYEGSATMKED